MSMDPLPGDPSYVHKQGAAMVTAADRMDRAASTLSALMNGVDYRSDAVSAIAANAEQLATVMTKASVRYRETGHALTDYAGVLDTAQQEANRAIQQESSTDVWGATGEVVALEARAVADEFNPLVADTERHDNRVRVAQAREELARHESASAQAHTVHAEAKRDVEQAAAIAIARIQDAIEASGLNDSFWDDFEGFTDRYVVPFLNIVIEVAAAVTKILDVVSLALAFVPGLQGLAAALKAVSLALNVASLVATILLTVVGERTLGQLLTASLLTAATVLKPKGAPTKKPGGFQEEMGLRDGTRYLFTKLKHQDVAWAEGGSEVLRYAVDEGVDTATRAVLPHDVADLLLDPQKVAAEQAGVLLDRLIPPEQQPSTDDLSTDDVAPLDTDFSSVDVDQIIASSFRDVPRRNAPVLVSVGGGTP